MTYYSFPTNWCRETLSTLAVAALIILACLQAAGANDSNSGDNLADFSLEELMSIEITTLSRKAENLGSAPAAVHVISQSDIRRSGARSIPELLRLVPGMQVAQIDGNKWAVTARGANGRFANKLLVLMDGRTLYNPLLSGVYWDVQDTDIAAIERIEVIRGPGATMWGSNAVNGIVNIITKHSADAQGGHLGVLGGQSGYEGVLRYGSKVGDSAFRVYGKILDRDGNVNLVGEDTEDYSEMARVGGRFDWDGHDNQDFTFSAEAYTGESGEYRISRSLIPPYEMILDTVSEMSGAFALARWSRNFASDSTLQINAYYDAHKRDGVTYTEDRKTFDLDIQYGFSPWQNHSLMWGLNSRFSRNKTSGTFEIQIIPAENELRLFSGFIQDEISLLDGNARLMIGSKFENNNLGDKTVEVEPSVRFSIGLGGNKTAWAAVSSAVRMPSRGEQNGRIVSAVLPPGQPQLPLPVPTVVVVNGNLNMKSEEVTAYEIGYRMRDAAFQFDVAAFYNQFSDLRSLQQGAPTCQPSGVLVQLDPTCLATATFVEAPLFVGSNTSYDAMGVELSVAKHFSERWRLHGTYTYFHTTDGSAGNGQELAVIEDSPDHQLSIRSSMDIGESLELDLWLRWIDELESQQIDAYAALDLRFAWSPGPALSVAAVGRNLFAGEHLEFMSELVDLAPVQIEPEAYIELRWNF